MILTGTISELVSILLVILLGIFLGYLYDLFGNLSSYFSLHCNCMLICDAASMARKIYLRGGLGVGAFQRIYGGSQRNGSRPPHFCKSSGSIARNILQQLQNMNIIEMDTKG